VPVDRFNRSAAGLVVILPITTKDKGIPSHVRVEPQKHGLTRPSFIKCEEVRCIPKDRLVRLYDTIDSKSMTEVEYRLRIILGLCGTSIAASHGLHAAIRPDCGAVPGR